MAMRGAACVLTALLLAACATVTKGIDQQVALDTPGFPGSQCTLTSKGIGVKSVITPVVVTLPKSRFDIAVECVSKCAKGTGMIASNLEGMTAGNIVLGGVVGLGVDAASGAMNKYAPQTQIVMTTDPACTG